MSVWDGFCPPSRDEDGDSDDGGYQDSDVLDDSQATWRGTVHLEDWPEHLAGPEYRLNKDDLENGEEGA